MAFVDVNKAFDSVSHQSILVAAAPWSSNAILGVCSLAV